jgi:hypothetical protein
VSWVGHMGVVGFFSLMMRHGMVQMGQICFYGLAFQRKVNRMYNIHQQAMSQRNASIPVSTRDMTFEQSKASKIQNLHFAP